MFVRCIRVSESDTFEPKTQTTRFACFTATTTTTTTAATTATTTKYDEIYDWNMRYSHELNDLLFGSI